MWHVNPRPPPYLVPGTSLLEIPALGPGTILVLYINLFRQTDRSAVFYLSSYPVQSAVLCTGWWQNTEYRIQNTESLLSTLIVTDHQCYRAIKSLQVQTTVHSNTIDTYNTRPRKYQCHRYISQELKPMGAQLSLKVAMPLAEIPATSRKNASNRGPWGPRYLHQKAPNQKPPAESSAVIGWC